MTKLFNLLQRCYSIYGWFLGGLPCGRRSTDLWECPAMKTLLVGIAFAMGMVFASQAFALPYCPNHTWQNGHFVCDSYNK